MPATPTAGYHLRPGSLTSSQRAQAIPWLCIPDPLPHDGGNYQPFTVEHWLYLDANNENAGLLSAQHPESAWDDAGINLYIRSQSGAGYAWTVSGTSTRDGTPPIGEWVHVAWVFTGSEIQTWENGVQIRSRSMPSILENVESVMIGQTTSPGRLRRLGPHRIAGMVTVENAPARRHVMLLDRRSLIVVDAVLSKEDGAYEFDALPLATYTLLAHDSYGEFDAVAADMITPVARQGGEQ